MKKIASKLRNGDQVKVLCGRSKGSTGKIETINRLNSSVVVSGVNIYKKHKKPTSENPDGGIVDKPMPLHISNVALVDPKTKKATKVGYKME